MRRQRRILGFEPYLPLFALELVAIDATPLETIPCWTTATAQAAPSEHHLPVHTGTVRG